MKYTQQQLKEMASRLLEAKRNGDFRYIQFITVMQMRTGREPNFIEQKIIEFAKASA